MLKITIFVPQNIKLKIMNKITLSNGVEMPQMGYGVYQVTPDEGSPDKHGGSFLIL